MNIESMKTPILRIDRILDNELYIKRDDLIPYSFGGNKARKAALFFEEILNGEYDCVVTYGSSSSNHVRIVANLCCSNNLECYVITPKEASETTFNSKLREMFNVKATEVSVEEVHDTIEQLLCDLKSEGHNPYFIPGGGHGNLGTQAYDMCYDEIKEFETETGTFFDYIFFASGTGTTHAGLVCGMLKHNDKRTIVGISIARKNPRGRNVVIESIKEYMGEDSRIEDATVFVDDFIGGGYAKADSSDTIKEVMLKYGIPLDSTYTGKAYSGMCEYIKNNRIKDKNILFIHTGGTPLFFDSIQ